MVRSLLKRLRMPGMTPAPARRSSESVVLQLEGRQIILKRVRDGRAKRLRLVVDERGPRLTQPLCTSDTVADRFVHANAAWLLQQINAITRAVPEGPALVIEQTTHLPLWGEECAVHWVRDRHTHVAFHDGTVVFHHTAQATAAALKRALADFYIAQARMVIAPLIAQYLPGLPRAPRRVVFKQTSSQWGSLTPDGTVNLDLSLVLAPPAALSYVVIHELCHLIQANHSPAFWADVEARCPQWPQQRDWLASEGRRIKHRLRLLLAAEVSPALTDRPSPLPQ